MSLAVCAFCHISQYLLLKNVHAANENRVCREICIRQKCEEKSLCPEIVVVRTAAL